MKDKIYLLDLLHNWDLGRVKSIDEIDNSKQVYIITSNVGNKYILKEKESLSKLQIEHKLLFILEKNGIPVSTPIKNKQDDFYIEIEDKYFSVYSYLKGHVMKDHYSDKGEEQAVLLGIAIAKLHKGLGECDLIKDFPRMDIINNVFTWVLPKLQEKSDALESKNTRDILNKLRADMEFLLRKLPTQLIHRDPHPGNILFLDGKISGFLDFEISVRGVRIFDISYVSTAILVDGFDDDEKRLKWFRLLTSLILGYGSISPLTKLERDSIWYVLLSIEAIFMAYFCELGNIDEAKKNQEVFLWIYENKDNIVRAL